MLVIITLIIISASAYLTIRKRVASDRNYSKKSWVTPVCLHLAPVVALISYAYEGIGGLGFLILGILFIVSAYYTKELPK
ncbi:hypothetical protein [Halobacillus salinus]|uniref:Uncharacterized protein n=1 Tax=Halobacillus salinus TaxID=192814 RepID=A0A4Z0H592_9BACI|nr:hypothetical protein [Halobacillus salinus]TGB04416.1 hypothetical protein E4663_05320 [Halobacillus salinus]